MVGYRAPVKEQRFVLEATASFEQLATLPGFEEASGDLVDNILSEAARLSETVFSPLNPIGDRQGARLTAGSVALPAGFVEGYRRYVEGGWMGLAAPTQWGGQGLPFVLGCAVQEQMTSANMAFSLCAMLSHGAIEALAAHGSDKLKADYLTKLISGEWTGTMNLTEPQAGSDVGAIRTRADRHPNGSYRIQGSKIFITWGEHDAATNIVHLVLARLPDAPAGTKGISLFLVPKYLPDGSRNDVRCISLEHKLGLHGSPTCTMSFGDEGGCIGWLVGEENAGMRAMFTMMNHARINVGLQGVAIAERAWQAALAFARERVQSGPIIHHPDVRRMLMTMKAQTEAARALVYFTAAQVDRAHAEPDPERRARAQGLSDLLTPVAKAWATDIGVQVASDAIQVYGGMGYVEETGAAQHLRDARITTIYEGTNGIQALDLVGRKLRIDNGRHWQMLFAEMREDVTKLEKSHALASLAAPLGEAITLLEEKTQVVAALPLGLAAASATSYLGLFGMVAGGVLLGRQALAATVERAADASNGVFIEAKIATVIFFIEQLLPRSMGLAAAIAAGVQRPLTLDEEGLASGWI